MQLTHTFTVPIDRDTAWAAFQDIGSVAECFPGASVTSTEGDSFKGTVKVKLGPIALQYAGSGEFIERDASAYRMVIKAQGRDKRGNGTAGADVVATFADAGGGTTRVEVATDLNITGKPAQFGRGVMQDVSDKLLGQFVECLESKIAPPAAPVQPPEPSPVSSAAAGSAAAGSAAAGSAAAGSSAAGSDAGSGGVTDPLTVPDEITVPEEVAAPGDSSLPASDPVAATPPGAGAATGPGGAAASASVKPPGAAPGAATSDALDLGTTLLPVLLRTYAKQAAGLAVVLAVLVWVLRRRR